MLRVREGTEERAARTADAHSPSAAHRNAAIHTAALRTAVDQNAKTALPFRVAFMAQALENVCFQATRLPCQTPSAVTVTGS